MGQHEEILSLCENIASKYHESSSEQAEPVASTSSDYVTAQANSSADNAAHEASVSTGRLETLRVLDLCRQHGGLEGQFLLQDQPATRVNCAADLERLVDCHMKEVAVEIWRRVLPSTGTTS